MIKKVRIILIAWLKRYEWLPSSEAEQKLSDTRLKICATCPFGKTTPILELLDTGGEYVNTLYCKQCGCPCRQKSLIVSEECPIRLW